MRKRQLSNENGWRLYPTPRQYETILDYVPEVNTYSDEKEVELFIRLGAESGLRGEERMRATRQDIVDPSDESLDAKFLEVYGKNTSNDGNERKYRKTVLTKATVACIDELLDRVDREPDDVLIDINRNTMYRWMRQIGELAADETGDEDFEHLSPHDLRAYFATNCLVRHNMNMETVMTVGGWDSYEAMKSYLSITSDETIVQDFQEAGLLEGAGWDEYVDEEIGDSIYSRLNASTPMGAAAQLSALGADQMASRVESVAEHTTEDEWTLGRFTRQETETAVRAAKYGAGIGLVGAALTTSVPSLQPELMAPLATAGLLPPLALGWHRTE